MDNNIKFAEAPTSDELVTVYPGDKGILLFYENGDIKELYGREHVMMMQEIGYWYIDNWQDFLLNYSYNGVIVVMFESGNSFVYLPKDVPDKQKNSLIKYIEKNVSLDKRHLLEFYIIHCLEKNENSNKFTSVQRDNRGMIKHIIGKVITEEDSVGYDELCEYLNDYTLKDDNFKLMR